MSSKRLGDALARPLVVHIEWIAIKWRDLRRPRSARCRGFCAHNPLDGGEHALADPRVECANVQLDERLVRYNVFLRAGLQDPDGDDGRLGRGHLAGHDALETHDGCGSHDYGIDA